MASIINTQISPGVNTSEIDLTTVVPTLGTTTGAIAGVFPWGPVLERTLISDEAQLVATFGKPNSNNAETFFTAANFLSYGNALYVVRTANTTNGTGNTAPYFNAVANTGTVANVAHEAVQSEIDFAAKAAASYAFDANTIFLAKYPGAIGNSLKVSVCDSPNAFSSNVNLYANADVFATLTVNIGSSRATIIANSATSNITSTNTFVGTIASSFAVGDVILLGNTSIGTQYNKIKAINNTSNATYSAVTIQFYENYKLATDFVVNTSVNSTNSTNAPLQRFWEYRDVFNLAPNTSNYVFYNGNTVNWSANSTNSVVDTMHVVVIDQDGQFTGVPNAILETYQSVSRATDAVGQSGQSIYYKTVINNQSNYIWAIKDRTDATANSANAMNILAASNGTPLSLSFISGQDGAAEGNTALSVVASGYDLFNSPTDVQVSLIMQGKPIGGSTTSGGMTANNFYLANYIIDNIVPSRKDAVVFITPDDGIVAGNKGNEGTAIVNWRNTLHTSNFAFVDSGYKYQYDRYNDVYRYVPTNGDIAGLCVRTDLTSDPWYSPAGFNRGQIKNLVRMRYNPDQTNRDLLYSNQINPVVSFQGQGTILYGDKTLVRRPSAFDRLNVRRLFITIEQAINNSSNYTLFEFNDSFTRAQFVNLITPYLKDIKARRGITDFYVVCDESNNTPERIDRNQFWCDIYIKPSRSINFVQLNFVAVATGVQFTEVVGSY